MVITDYLPHKGKMVLVDNVYQGNNINGYIYGWGERKLTDKEYWAEGHFNIMPATALIESMAQVAGCVFLSFNKEYVGKPFYLASVKEAKFLKPVMVGDNIEIYTKIHKPKMCFVTADCMVKVDNENVASCEITLWGCK